jgi:hypothetical protein
MVRNWRYQYISHLKCAENDRKLKTSRSSSQSHEEGNRKHGHVDIENI